MTPGWRLVGRDPAGRVVWIGTYVGPRVAVADVADALNVADRLPAWLLAEGVEADTVWSADPEPAHAPWCSCDWCTMGGPPNVIVTGT